jgi:uncharacterized membrane protein
MPRPFLLLCWSCLLVACGAREGAASAKASPEAKCAVASDACAKPSFDAARAAVKARCATCHSPSGGEGGKVHDFTSDEVVQNTKKDILSELSTCSMPPAGAPPLGDQERAAIACWASAP